jgi:hypothetical protein
MPLPFCLPFPFSVVSSPAVGSVGIGSGAVTGGVVAGGVVRAGAVGAGGAGAGGAGVGLVARGGGAAGDGAAGDGAAGDGAVGDGAVGDGAVRPVVGEGLATDGPVTGDGVRLGYVVSVSVDLVDGGRGIPGSPEPVSAGSGSGPVITGPRDRELSAQGQVPTATPSTPARSIAVTARITVARLLTPTL